MKQSLVKLILGLALICALSKQSKDKRFFYEVLEVPFWATDDEIKKAYTDLSKQYHPDRSRSSDKYVKIQRAYEVLSSRIKKLIYDTDGLEEVERYEHAKANGYAGQRYRRSMDSRVTIMASLEDAYRGAERNVVITRGSLCRKCQGTGAKNGELKHCHHCHGRGMVYQQVRAGNGFVMQVQTHCPHCGGRGHMPTENCPVCSGRKIVHENKSFKISIERGAHNGEEVVFEGEGDEEPTSIPGDVRVEITLREHPLFKRQGDDLHAKLNISFQEAIFGFSKTIKQLDGRTVEISKSDPSQPNSIIILKGEGMPKRSQPGEFGDMHLEVVYELPKKLNAEQIRLVKAIFD
jgi:DnaJ-related protein SCJ1